MRHEKVSVSATCELRFELTVDQDDEDGLIVTLGEVVQKIEDRITEVVNIYVKEVREVTTV